MLMWRRGSMSVRQRRGRMRVTILGKKMMITRGMTILREGVAMMRIRLALLGRSKLCRLQDLRLARMAWSWKSRRLTRIELG
jgi:hypothetical protein